MSNLSQMVEFNQWSEKLNSYNTIYNMAKQDMLNSIGNVEQKKANDLAEVLNKLIAENSFNESEMTTLILNRLPSVIDRSGEKALENLSVEGFKVTTSASSDAWGNYKRALKEYKQAEDNSVNKIKAEDDVDKALKDALAAQGSLNKIQGDVFEAFLQEALPSILGKKVEDISNNTINEIIKSFENKKIIQTQGGVLETIELNFDDEKIEITSQGKTDVSIQAPFISEDFPLNISAKNYSKIRDVSLLDKGSVLGLVSQWPTSMDAKIHFLNGLTVWKTPEEVLSYGRVLLAIQSLAGKSGNKDALSNVFIINIRNSVKPIRVISIKALLQQLNIDNVDEMFKFKFKPQLPLFASGEMRTKEAYKERIKSLTLNTHLNKKMIYLNYIKNLTTT